MPQMERAHGAVASQSDIGSVDRTPTRVGAVDSERVGGYGMSLLET